ncbi:MAG: PilZ domain-containing protein [Sphingomonadaceae bacterium]
MVFDTKNRYEAAAQEDRCAPRSEVTIPAHLRVSGGHAFQTVVHDLSLSGFSATAINRLHPGQVCWLTLPGIEALQSEVIWWDYSQVGCAFQNLLNPIIHGQILERYQPDAARRKAR